MSKTPSCGIIKSGLNDNRAQISSAKNLDHSPAAGIKSGELPRIRQPKGNFTRVESSQLDSKCPLT